MKKYSKEFYINIGFVVFLFVLTFSFIKENVFRSDSVLIGVLSGMLAGIICFGLAWILRDKSLWLKIGVLAIWIIFIAIVAHYKTQSIQ